MDRVSQTERIIRAVSNPYTTILGHMTGRQLLRRPGYEIDTEKVLAACAEHGVAVEINANPWRLDLDWRWHDIALKLGCLMSINPDAVPRESWISPIGAWRWPARAGCRRREFSIASAETSWPFIWRRGATGGSSSFRFRTGSPGCALQLLASKSPPLRTSVWKPPTTNFLGAACGRQQISTTCLSSPVIPTGRGSPPRLRSLSAPCSGYGRVA